MAFAKIRVGFTACWEDPAAGLTTEITQQSAVVSIRYSEDEVTMRTMQIARETVEQQFRNVHAYMGHDVLCFAVNFTLLEKV